MATLATPTQNNIAARLKNILFATDFSEASLHALPYAAELAKQFDATLFACHVITPAVLLAAAPQAAPYLYEAERDAVQKELDSLLQSPLLKGIKANALLPSGILGDCIVDEIGNNNVDLIVAGTHGRTGLRRLLLGSAVEEVCRVATCPVLTIGPDLPVPPAKYRRILVPTDLSDASLRSLPFVVRVAGEYGALVTVVHVLPEETAGNPDTKVLSEPVYRSMRHKIEPLLGDLKTDFVIESGDTVETILKVAFKKDADLIAMGIRGTFLPGFHLRTSVAYRVVAGAHCPVVTCR